ncbi:hypothetical protein [Bacillus alveayuensis]|uniref:hypothetical protein n=1 Tax=Aeribacillus alveayuensis TaxID=279215 RepID=UPI0005D1285E|nr:hypothetical protein [Bacillus alveayuensis]
MEIKLHFTKKGHPALWESGGGMTNTGFSQIICNADGSPKKPVYVKRRGHLSCGEHALFIVSVGDIIIQADHHRRDFEIFVMKICSIGDETAQAQIIHHFSMGEWNEEPPTNLKTAIEAAKEKATCYHCRSPHYTE